jgi:outer membrane lipoprotein-sorting protein
MGALAGMIALFLLVVPGPLPGQSDFLRRSEERARQILHKSVDALGGEAYLKARTIVREGKFFQFRRDDLRGSSKFRTLEAAPLKRRVELGKKGRIVLINDGEQGWKIEYKNVKTQSEEELRNFRIDMNHNLDYILRFRLREKDLKIRYLGKSRTHLDQLDGVQLMDASGDKVRIYVNSRTFLPVRMEFESPPRGKRWATEDKRFFHNYHEIDGVKIPFTTILNSNGYKASEVQLSSAQINADLSDSLFSSPQK